jgi:putative flippase GtrA
MRAEADDGAAITVWKKPWLRFVLVGLFQLCLDWGVFVLLTRAELAVPVANLLARAVNIPVGWFLQGRVTFGAALNAGTFLRYLLVFLLLTILSTLALLPMSVPVRELAKPLVEALLAIASFLLMQHFVFAKAK